MSSRSSYFKSPRYEAEGRPDEAVEVSGSGLLVVSLRALLGPALFAVIGLLFLGVAWPTVLAAQQTGTVTGLVVDVQSREPLSNAQVFVEGSGQGGLTNASGRFLLTQVPRGTQTLRVERIGYAAESQTVDVAAGAATTVDFSLRSMAYDLEGVIVTGTPGATRLRELGNSVGRIDVEAMSQTNASSRISDLLGGQEPGVELSFGGGGPDPSANIRIRGASSISLGSEPLIYIDGVRTSNRGPQGPGTSGRDRGLRLNDLSPNEIQSMEVIKGPAAATLYGTEASNGVINIITKSGTPGQPASITMKAETGFLGLPGFASGEDFYDLEIGYRCQGLPESDCTPGEIVRVNALRNDRERFGRNYFRNGLQQLYSANVRGGSEDVSYFFSGSWNDSEGVTFDSWKNTLNTRGNLNWTPNERYGVQFGLGLVWSDQRSSSSNQPWSLGVTFQCPAPTCEPGSQAGLDSPTRGYFAYTPYAMVDHVFGGEQMNRQTATMTFTHRPWEWFSGRFTVGADWVRASNHELYQPLPEGLTGHFVPDGLKRVQSNSEETYTIDYSATGSFDLTEDIGLSTSVGFQYYRNSFQGVFASGSGFPISTLSTISAGANKDAAENFVENKTAGVYIQEQVSFQDRLFLTGAVRFDDNSAFGQNFELVSYPKVSASWIVSEEGFMQDAGWIDQLKLRGAWGKAGQQPSTFAGVRTYNPVTGPGGQGAITRGNIGNPDVAPEVGQEWEAGFDGVFFDQRLTLETTYYDQTRNDALIQVAVRPSTGFGGTQWRNLGQTQNKGIELGVQFQALRDGAVGLDLGLNFSHNESKVTDLGGLPPIELHSSNPTTNWGHQRFAEGFPLGAIFLKKIVSTDIIGELGTPDARAVNMMCEGGEIIPGTQRLSRGGGAPVPCGDAPDIYRGTPVAPTLISSTATVRLLDGDLELFAQVDTKLGSTRIDANLAGAHVFVNSSLAILERRDPLLLAMQEMAADGINQTALVDADFARLRRLAATYRLPETFAGWLGADSGSFTLSGFNLAWLWRAQDNSFGLKTLDSESRVTTSGNGLAAVHHEGWPTNSQVTFSLSLSF